MLNMFRRKRSWNNQLNGPLKIIDFSNKTKDISEDIQEPDSIGPMNEDNPYNI